MPRPNQDLFAQPLHFRTLTVKTSDVDVKGVDQLRTSHVLSGPALTVLGENSEVISSEPLILQMRKTGLIDS